LLANKKLISRTFDPTRTKCREKKVRYTHCRWWKPSGFVLY